MGSTAILSLDEEFTDKGNTCVAIRSANGDPAPPLVTLNPTLGILHWPPALQLLARMRRKGRGRWAGDCADWSSTAILA